MTDSEIEDLIAGRRPELAYLLNESELQGFLRGDCYIVDCLRRPSILRDCGAAPNDGLSSGIIGLDIGGNCPMRGGIAWCRQGEARPMDHESCMCAGVPMGHPEK